MFALPAGQGEASVLVARAAMLLGVSEGEGF